MSRWRSKARLPWLRLFRSFSNRSSEDKLRAVPFTRSVEEAKSAYDKHHRGILSFVPSRSPALQENFLPFWAAASNVHVQVTSASLGFWETRWGYNFSSKRMERRHEMVYRTFTWSDEQSPKWTRTYEPASDLIMQIYASFDYPRAHVKGICSRDTFRGARRLTVDMVEDSHHLGRMRGLGEFIMRPGAAIVLARDAIYSSAREQAKEILMRTYGADSVQFLDLDVQYLTFSISPIYVPVFIFESTYLRETVRTFLHGSTLATGGQKLYNVPIAALAGGALAALAVAVLGDSGFPPFLAVVLPALAFGCVAFLYPLAALKLQNWFRAREESRHFWGGPYTWDEEYITAFDVREAGARQKQEKFREEERSRSSYSGYRYRSQQQQQGRTSRNHDPKRLYAALGLPAGANENEIKSAFRSLALKYHPDRYTDTKQKQMAKVKFQEISAAYDVLRNANKRKMYDETGKTI